MREYRNRFKTSGGVPFRGENKRAYFNPQRSSTVCSMRFHRDPRSGGGFERFQQVLCTPCLRVLGVSNDPPHGWGEWAVKKFKCKELKDEGSSY